MRNASTRQTTRAAIIGVLFGIITVGAGLATVWLMVEL